MQKNWNFLGFGTGLSLPDFCCFKLRLSQLLFFYYVHSSYVLLSMLNVATLYYPVHIWCSANVSSINTTGLNGCKAEQLDLWQELWCLLTTIFLRVISWCSRHLLILCSFRRRCIREGRLHCELVNKPWSSSYKVENPQIHEKHRCI